MLSDFPFVSGSSQSVVDDCQYRSWSIVLNIALENPQQVRSLRSPAPKKTAIHSATTSHNWEHERPYMEES